MDFSFTDLLSREQAAAELKRSLATIDQFNRKGRLPYQRIGGKCIRILCADLERLKSDMSGEAR